MNLRQAVNENLEKHYPGLHDQQSHGRGRASVEESFQDALGDALRNREIARAREIWSAMGEAGQREARRRRPSVVNELGSFRSRPPQAEPGYAKDVPWNRWDRFAADKPRPATKFQQALATARALQQAQKDGPVAARLEALTQALESGDKDQIAETFGKLPASLRSHAGFASAQAELSTHTVDPVKFAPPPPRWKTHKGERHAGPEGDPQSSKYHPYFSEYKHDYHTPRMQRCLYHLEAEQGHDPAASHAICYSSILGANHRANYASRTQQDERKMRRKAGKSLREQVREELS